MLHNHRIKLLCAAFTLAAAASAQTAPKLRADNIDEVLHAMTLEEKAQLLVGDGNAGFVGSGAMLGHQSRLVAGAAGQTVSIARLGIPATVLTDGPAGVHIDPKREGTTETFYATGFPVGTCLASTWNPQLVYNVGQAMGKETLEYGCDVILGPGLNIQRNPLGGRNFEYYSEDPLVTGIIGAAMIRGIQSQGVGTSPKHFAVNSQEGDRTRVDERVSQRDRVDAILVAWQPGEEGGNSVADVLTGKVNPSGHLTATWPVSISDDPSTDNFPQSPVYYNFTDKFAGGNLKGVNYSNHEEDIYVGYRYYDTFGRKPAYPFGYGLSYTTFDFSKLSAKKSGDNIVVTVSVKNTGKVAGKQVAQVYVAAPKGNLEKPAKELKAFAKTRLLQPGESETLTMTIPVRDLASFDSKDSQWLADAGTYTFLAGDNVEHTTQKATLKLGEYTEKTSDALPLNVSLNLLKTKN